MGRLLGRIWVGFTTSLIIFIAYSSQIFIIWPWYGRVLSVELLQLLLPFKYATSRTSSIILLRADGAAEVYWLGYYFGTITCRW